jgi:hypothetical protein
MPYVVLTEFIEYTFQFLIEAVLHIINFILYSDMNVQNNDDTGDLFVLRMTSCR